MSAARKSGAELFKRIERVIEFLRTEWGITVIALCSDAGPDVASARRMAFQAYSELIVPDCYAHQMNLLVGGYFKISGTWYLLYATQATELIGWLRSKSLLLTLLQQKHAMIHSTKPLTVLRAVLTRWTSHYIAYERLSKLRLAITLVIDNDETLPENDPQKCVVVGDRDARLKAAKMVALIHNPQFWRALDR